MSTSVIYGRHGDGVFKGKIIGERKYQVDFSSSTLSMGTYHFIDGERIGVYYRGNTRTCGRCHKSSSECHGGGIAKDCQELGGDRIDHMKKLWETMGSPLHLSSCLNHQLSGLKKIKRR